MARPIGQGKSKLALDQNLSQEYFSINIVFICHINFVNLISVACT